MNKQGIGLWIAVCILLVLDIAVHCVRAQDNTPALLKAQEVEIVDSSGAEKIDLRVSKDGSPVIALYDSKDNARAGLVASDTGGDLQLLDADGKTVVALSGDTNPSLSLFKSEKEEAFFGVRDDGWPVATLEDSAGSDRVFLGYDPDKDRCLLQLNDKDNKQTAEVAVVPDYAVIDVTDKAGTRRAALKCTSDDVPTSYVADKDGQPVWSETDPGAK